MDESSTYTLQITAAGVDVTDDYDHSKHSFATLQEAFDYIDATEADS